MPYDDDEDLFGEEFDFVDEDEADGDQELEPEKPASKRPSNRAKSSTEKSNSRAPKRGKSTAKPTEKSTAAKRGARTANTKASEDSPASVPHPKGAPTAGKPDVGAVPVGYINFNEDESYDEEPADLDPVGQSATEPAGPPADHVVHIYEYGRFKRTISRKFTDEEAVSFAEEYNRTGKAYGRRAIAAADSEEPSPTLAAAIRG